MTPVLAVKDRVKQLSQLASVNAQPHLIQLWFHDKPRSTKWYFKFYQTVYR